MNIIILLLIIILIIYNISGIYIVIPLILAIINFIASTFNLIIDPNNILSKLILVTKNSNPVLISKFLLNQISLADENLDLNYDLILQLRLNKGAPYVLVKYNQINLF